MEPKLATCALAVLCIAGFAYSAMYGNDFFGFSRDNLFQRPYVLVTSIFLHGSLEHLLSNLLVLVFFGLAVEKELGWRKMLVIFFTGAFAGDLLSLLVYAPGEISVGASAGIFALIGAGMFIPADLSFYPMFHMPLSLLGIAYAVYNVFGFVTNIDPQVSYIAHFGGLFAGIALDFRKGELKKRLKVIVITFIIMIAIPLAWIAAKGA